MKKNQAVLNRVYKYRERKGIKITDTDSVIYKVFKAVYIFGMIWFFATSLLYILGQCLQLSDSLASKAVLMSPFYLICSSTFALVIGTVLLLKFKMHITAGIINITALTIAGYEFNYLLVGYNAGIDGASKFWLRHGAAGAVMALGCIVLCFIGIRAKAILNKDYKRVLEIIYINNKERLSSSNDSEWDKIIGEISDSEIDGIAVEETE